MIFAPFAVGQLLHGLEGIAVVWRVALVDQKVGRPLWLKGKISVAFRMARSARLVATGYLWANYRRVYTMQQKYSVQGRYNALLTTTCPICFARSSSVCSGNP